jgi:hypothetical protein
MKLEEVKPGNDRFINLKKDIEAEQKENSIWPQIQNRKQYIFEKS